MAVWGQRFGAKGALNRDDIPAMISRRALDIIEVMMRVAKWGASLAVRLPKKLVEDMGLLAGDDVTVVLAKDRTISVEKDRRRDEALECLASMRLTLPPDYKFDRDEAHER